jgi:Flp pilus assembly protein TadD
MRKIVAFCVLLVSISLVYSNTLDVPAHFDDHVNIFDNSKIHLSELSYQSVKQAFHAHPNTQITLYRPVAMLSFGINWYIGQADVRGYHMVNIAIHIATAFLLFLTVFSLIDSPVLNDKYKKHQYGIALLTATLWALNPIQTQAVTYIVQRMAAMGAMFYLLAIFAYIKGRLSTNVHWYIVCFMAFMLALGCKEHTITLPLSLFLVEVLFFQSLKKQRTTIKFFTSFVVIINICIFVGGKIFLNGNVFSFLNAFAGREYSLSGRLLTEPRVLVFHLSQIFYPIAERFSIEHDFTISTSLFEPITTLFSFVVVIFLLVLALFKFRKYPLTSFAILFFFLAHSVESTIIPLELVFEHRNYLPSFFLFLPVAVGFFLLHARCRQRTGLSRFIVGIFVFLLITLQGMGCYVRNLAWASEFSLWEDALQKAPGRARPAYWLGRYYHLRGHLDKAMDYYEKSYSYRAERPKYSKAIALNGMAGIFLLKNENEKGIQLLQKAVTTFPEFDSGLLNLVRELAKQSRFNEAVEPAEKLLKIAPKSSGYHYLNGLIHLRLNNYGKSINYFQKGLDLDPQDSIIMSALSMAYQGKGEPVKASELLNQALILAPQNERIALAFIENKIRSGNKSEIREAFDSFYSIFGATVLRKQLEYSGNSLVLPLDTTLLTPYFQIQL